MHNPVINTVIALGLLGLSAGAFASTYNGTCTTRPKSEWKSTADVKAHFTTQGYTVGKVKAGASCYEVYAKDRNGQKVELFVDPVKVAVVGQAGKP